MPNTKRRKYEVGEGADFITRKQAMKKLQLTLKDFRKLCILKGVYPREPKKRKIAQKGKSGVQTLYSKKDILFLGADPMIWEMRRFKTHFKKIGRARGMRDFETLSRLSRNHPKLDIDHIVKERYPSFVDALRDLDDCLTLLFLFANFPTLPGVPKTLTNNCRKLTIEFLHLVIEARALRKVFVSIKGYYYQAEIRGETITWIIPHYFGFQPQSKRDVDFKVMGHFVEFYITMLGFVNFRLYQQYNMFYPPKLSKYMGDKSEKELVHQAAFYSERIASLNVQLTKSKTVVEDEEQALDTFALSEDPDELLKIQKQTERTAKLKTLFDGLKVFVNREVSREPIVVCVRALGGEVSWDKTLFVGSTFDEDDETITHQIVDRPSMEKQYISRYYVQPQWVFDSVNAAQLLPVERYLMGVVLPPHLSPFNDEARDQRYKPPEELEMLAPQPKAVEAEDEDEEEEEDDDDEEEEDTEEEGEDDAGKVSGEDEEGDSKENDKDDDKPDEEKERLAKKKKMAVKRGTITKEDPLAPQREQHEEKVLRARMVRNKHRRLYSSMMEGRKKRGKEVKLLTKKREQLDAAEVAAKKEEKRQRKKAAAVLQA